MKDIYNFRIVGEILSALFLMDLLEDESDKSTLKALGIYFISIFASMYFLVAQLPTPTTGAYMMPFLALASASGGHAVLTILKEIFNCYSPGTGFDWGTAAALITIGAFLGLSVYWTVKGDMGYVVEAFT